MMEAAAMKVPGMLSRMTLGADDFKPAMRAFAGSVCVITVGDGECRTGFTASSVSSFSVEPPAVVFSAGVKDSSAVFLVKGARIGLNLLADDQQAIASRFAGVGGVQGEARYAGADWTTLAEGGGQVLDRCLVAMDCEIDHVVVHHGRVLVIAEVRHLRVAASAGAPLLYHHGAYRLLGGAL